MDWYWIAVVVALSLIGVGVMRRCKAASDRDEESGRWRVPETAPLPPVSPSGRPMAVCAECGRLVAVRKGDGRPYAYRHRCAIAMPKTVTDDPREVA